MTPLPRDALLFKKAKGHEAKLCYLGHVLIDNRDGLVVNSRLTRATGRAEWQAARAMAQHIPGRRRATLGADKHYDDRGFVAGLCTLKVTPHVAQKERTALDARPTRHAGYGVSQRVRKRVEEVFGWLERRMARVSTNPKCWADAPRVIRTPDLLIRSCRHTSPSVLIRCNP